MTAGPARLQALAIRPGQPIAGSFRPGQKLAAEPFYRPRTGTAGGFAPVKLFTIDELFGGWGSARIKHFDNRGIFGRISSANR